MHTLERETRQSVRGHTGPLEKTMSDHVRKKRRHCRDAMVVQPRVIGGSGAGWGQEKIERLMTVERRHESVERETPNVR